MNGSQPFFSRERLLRPGVAEHHDADEEVHQDHASEENGQVEDLDVLVGVVGGRIALSTKVHRLSHMVTPPFHHTDGRSNHQCRYQGLEVQSPLHPVSSPLQTLLFGLSDCVGIVTVVLVVFVDFHHHNRDPSEEERDGHHESEDLRQGSQNGLENQSHLQAPFVEQLDQKQDPQHPHFGEAVEGGVLS